MKFFKATSLAGIFCLSFTSIAAFADETPVWVKINITNNSYFLWDFQNSTITNSTFEGSNRLKPQGTTTVNIYPVFNDSKDNLLTLEGNLNYTLDNSAYGCSLHIVCKGWNGIAPGYLGCYVPPRTASATPFTSGDLYSTTCNVVGSPSWDPEVGLLTVNVAVNATKNN